MKCFLLLVLCLVSCGVKETSVRADYPHVPDDAMTPGTMCTAQDKDFKELRYQEKIAYCQRNVSYGTKTALYKAYDVPEADRSQYTIDHLIPLALGGNNSTTNLWPQNKIIYTGRIEYWLFCRLRDGTMLQAEAIKTILAIKHGTPSDVTQPDNCAEYKN